MFVRKKNHSLIVVERIRVDIEREREEEERKKVNMLLLPPKKKKSLHNRRM